MAFVLEDGTGITGANSYGEETGADAYFADRGGETVWTALATADKQYNLVKATDYIEKIFGRRWVGGPKVKTTQGLGWPRLFVYDQDGYAIVGLPVGLVKASYEYALRSASADLLPDPTVVDASGAAVQRIRKKVGPIETETEYAEGSALSRVLRRYPAADRLLSGLVRPQSLMRA